MFPVRFGRSTGDIDARFKLPLSLRTFHVRDIFYLWHPVQLRRLPCFS